MARKQTKAQQAAAKRSAAAKAGWATRKAEAKKRSDAAKKGWTTRKAAKTPPPAPSPVKPPSGSRKEPPPQRGGGGGGTGRGAGGRVYDYPPEFDEIDDFFGGDEYGEEDEY